jgi:PAS domain S-box-containing protein
MKSKVYTSLYNSIKKQVGKELEDAKIAASNVLEDLQVEKEALAAAKAKDEALLLSIGEGLVAVDNDGKILFVNKVAEGMLESRSQNLVGKTLTDFRLEDEMGNLISLAKRPTTLALADGKMKKVVYFFVRKNKTRFPIAITATPIRLDGKTIGLIEIIRDVTHEREIDKAKSEFVSIASHQLRTPLTSISWYTEMILNGDAGEISPKQKKYLGEIYEGNQRMVELVNALLNVSNLELGTFKIDPKPMQVADIAESVLAELQPQILSQKIIVKKSYGLSLPIIQADPKLIRIIFQNLFSNAIKYASKDNGEIVFSLSVQKSNIRFKVWNNGPGIPKEAQPKIFTKLFRDDLAKQKDPNGNGLGLYIVRSILEKLGGKIFFESNENKGTTFFITLPFRINM